MGERRKVVLLHTFLPAILVNRSDLLELTCIVSFCLCFRGRVLFFFVVLISLLEMIRQISPLEYRLEAKNKDYMTKYVVLSEKAFGLCLAWYVTFWITMLSKRGRRAGSRSGLEELSQEEEPQQEPRSSTDSWRSSDGEIDLTGVWIKDRKKSDSLAGVCEIANINFILRKAICLVRGSELNLTDQGLSIRVFSEIPWFSLNEYYAFKTESLNKRRDFRRGKMRCTMKKQKNGLKFFMEWPEPWGGFESTQYILLDEGNTLQVKTDCTIRDRSISYQTLYHRRH